MSSLDTSGILAITAAAYAAGDPRRVLLEDTLLAALGNLSDAAIKGRGVTIGSDLAPVDVPWRTSSERMVSMPRLFTRSAAACAAACPRGSDVRVGRDLQEAIAVALTKAAG